jgi:23S rRNA (pseudouridine1915-N3)-methyltransferase
VRIVLAIAASIKDRPMKAAIGDYLTRASHVYRSELVEVGNDAVRRESDVPVARAREAERLLDKAPRTWLRIALDERGELLTSHELAALLEKAAVAATPGVAFLVGAPHGLDPALVAGCNRSLALSRMTLNHQHAMLVLAEQIYRATTIVSGVPYHK